MRTYTAEEMSKLTGEVTSTYSAVTLNVARPDMNNYATLGVMLY